MSETLPAIQDPGSRDVVGRSAPHHFSIIPRDLGEAMEIAKLIASSTLCPANFRGKPGDVVIVMMQSAELEIPYFQGLQNIAVINGRPTIWGDLVVALVQRSGKLEYLRREWDEASKTATVTIKRKGFPEAVASFSMEDAKRAKLAGKDTYIQFPQRMCMWRALTFAVRNEFADVLKGMAVTEEALDSAPMPIVEPGGIARPMAQLVQGFLAPPVSEKKAREESEPSADECEVVRIASAEIASEGKSKTGKPWTLFKVMTEDGRALATFSSSIWETAIHAKDQGVPVRITTSPGKKPGQLNVVTMDVVFEDQDDATEEGAE